MFVFESPGTNLKGTEASLRFPVTKPRPSFSDCSERITNGKVSKAVTLLKLRLEVES